MKHLAAIILLLALPPAPRAAELSSLSRDAEYPRVYRTFMPEAGPSAFAVELSPDLALCYDPLRGGVNQAWRGSIDLSPTWAAKINAPAKIVGEVFYREKEVHPLRLEDPASPPRHRFKGYRYEKGAVVFEFTLGGRPVTETLRPSEDGRGLVREIALPPETGPAFLELEAQPRADLSVTGGTQVRPGLWRFAGGSRFTLLITPKTATSR